ncbi:hypothetical protein CALVIDRAFT_537972 [Calocera viscosa TUFC12733]|uniref:C3H1-type domain-containing protein n=1 Tax=Calocera viscosa (strain TUFC12733) TaxID=1330018 RepID=A0A167LDM4_CALVF|nr:hypothetical protein CALVIDRAFT_537972 [Calocera viscosa TUFC12733]
MYSAWYVLLLLPCPLLLPARRPAPAPPACSHPSQYFSSTGSRIGRGCNKSSRDCRFRHPDEPEWATAQPPRTREYELEREELRRAQMQMDSQGAGSASEAGRGRGWGTGAGAGAAQARDRDRGWEGRRGTQDGPTGMLDRNRPPYVPPADSPRPWGQGQDALPDPLPTPPPPSRYDQTSPVKRPRGSSQEMDAQRLARDKRARLDSDPNPGGNPNPNPNSNASGSATNQPQPQPHLHIDIPPSGVPPEVRTYLQSLRANPVASPASATSPPTGPGGMRDPRLRPGSAGSAGKQGETRTPDGILSASPVSVSVPPSASGLSRQQGAMASPPSYARPTQPLRMDSGSGSGPSRPGMGRVPSAPSAMGPERYTPGAPSPHTILEGVEEALPTPPSREVIMGLAQRERQRIVTEEIILAAEARRRMSEAQRLAHRLRETARAVSRGPVAGLGSGELAAEVGRAEQAAVVAQKVSEAHMLAVDEGMEALFEGLRLGGEEVRKGREEGELESRRQGEIIDRLVRQQEEVLKGMKAVGDELARMKQAAAAAEESRAKELQTLELVHGARATRLEKDVRAANAAADAAEKRLKALQEKMESIEERIEDREKRLEGASVRETELRETIQVLQERLGVHDQGNAGRSGNLEELSAQILGVGDRLDNLEEMHHTLSAAVYSLPNAPSIENIYSSLWPRLSVAIDASVKGMLDKARVKHKEFAEEKVLEMWKQFEPVVKLVNDAEKWMSQELRRNGASPSARPPPARSTSTGTSSTGREVSK